MDHCLAYRLDGNEAEVNADKDDNNFYLMFNGSKNDQPFSICTPPKGTLWFRAIDTSLPGEDDIPLYGKEEYLENQEEYMVRAKSIVVLLSIQQ